MKIIKYIVLFLSVLFVGIVVLEQFPGVMVPSMSGMDHSKETEYLMYGLFKITLLDDITHLLSGIVGFYCLLKGYKMQVYFLILFGSYYALDAVFYVLNGIITGQPLIENLSLNGPHIGIGLLCIFGLKMSIKKIELK